jgi:hypothetical protein
MAIVSASFEAVGASASLRLQSPQDFTYSLSGTYDAVISLQRAKTPAENAWETIAGPFSVADATVTGRVSNEQPNQSYRWVCDVYESGEAVVEMATLEKVQWEYKDQFGRVRATLTDERLYLAEAPAVGSIVPSGVLRAGSYTALAADETAGEVDIVTGLSTIVSLSVSVLRAGVVVTSDAAVSASGGTITVADGATFDLAEDDVIHWIAVGA